MDHDDGMVVQKEKAAEKEKGGEEKKEENEKKENDKEIQDFPLGNMLIGRRETKPVTITMEHLKYLQEAFGYQGYGGRCASFDISMNKAKKISGAELKLSPLETKQPLGS
eukprot:630941-Ditylum_brightwellii.AAC.1